MVFTLPQYAKRYSDEGFKSFLSKIFATKTVLFLGYSLSETEILSTISRASGPPSYALVPYSAGDESLCEHYQQYYQVWNINQIPYYVGNDNYYILDKILKNWLEYILDWSKKRQRDTDNLLNFVETSPVDVSPEHLLHLIQNEDLLNRFLHKLLDSKYGSEWIIRLFDYLFDKPANEIPYYAEDPTKAPRWYPLIILSHIFEKNPDSTELQSKVFGLIQTICSNSVPPKGQYLNPIILTEYTRMLSLIPGSMMTAYLLEPLF